MGVNVANMPTALEPLLSDDYFYLYRAGNAAGSRAKKFLADALVTKTAEQTLENKTLDAAEITTSLTPASNDGAALGSAAQSFSDLFLASGSVINWSNGDVVVTHSANTMTFTGASSGYRWDAALLPNTSDGAALGSASLMWADLFLASGAVLNFNNGNVTITHSAGALVSTGTFQATAFHVSGTKVLGAQGIAVADPAGGATVDTECRSQLIALLARLRAHGIIAT